MANRPKSLDNLFDFPQSTLSLFPILTLASYISPLPLVIWLAGPSGFSSKFLVPVLSSTLSCLSGNDRSDPRKLVVLLTAIWIFAVYILSAVMSVTGQLMGNKEGYRNKEPRLHKRHIHGGLAHRLISTHEALYDVFPAYAVTAALVALSIPPGSAGIEGSNAARPINPLVLHVFFKLFIYVPAYISDVSVLRSISHTCSISALLIALWQIMSVV